MAGEKILLVEDNELNLELAVDLLETSGYDVITAMTAESGIELARAESPHVILMDISLPGMDGLEATAILKQDTRTKKIPVIALTAHAMKGDNERALQAGCNGYITKPINTREFGKYVSKILNQPG